MKTFLSLSTLLFLILAASNSTVNAQLTGSVQEVSIAAGAPQPPAIRHLIYIPDDISPRIVQKNGDNSVNYLFRKSDGTTAFLFQVSRISENQWLHIRNQLSDPLLLEHKNGFIYFAIVTTKHKIRGEDNSEYQAVYDRLRQIVASIKITEEGIN